MVCPLQNCIQYSPTKLSNRLFHNEQNNRQNHKVYLEKQGKLDLDYIKLFANNEKDLESLIETIKIYIRDM